MLRAGIRILDIQKDVHIKQIDKMTNKKALRIMEVADQCF